MKKKPNWFMREWEKNRRRKKERMKDTKRKRKEIDQSQLLIGDFLLGNIGKIDKFKL